MVEALLGQDFEENCARFFPEAMEQGCVWTLEGDSGFALCASEKYADAEVMPFWSRREYAEFHLQEDWADYAVVAVDLQEFFDDWLTGMHSDVLLVGINWDTALAGEEIEPLDLLAALEQEL